MKFNFSTYPVSSRGYSERPMLFLDAGPSAALTAVAELALIETGNRAGRERWQKMQLRNLLTHATQRSGFWRSRLGMRSVDSKLGTLPILTRMDVRQQVALEGSLLRPSDGLQFVEHATSGSSGVPVKFFVSQMNAQYNGARGAAQYFIDGKDLSLNNTIITVAKLDGTKKIAEIPSGFTVEKSPSWLGDLGSIFTSGGKKSIVCLNPDMRALVRELRKDPVGYLLTHPGVLSPIVSYSGAQLLHELQVRECINVGDQIEPSLLKTITDQGIAARSSYSCAEVGLVAFECGACAGHYHVATSNVIVEVVDVSHEVDGKKLGRVLVTHLHSYATPFIRYELGDLALMKDRCPCGHDGPTIHSLYGRVTNALKRRDGKLSNFHIRGPELLDVVEFTEFRIRQVALDTIVVEIGGRENLTPEETDRVIEFLKLRAGDEYKIDVIPRAAIDWGDSIKRLSFRSEV